VCGLLKVAPDRIRLADKQRTVLLVDKIEQRVPEHPRAAPVDKDAIFDRLPGGGAGLGLAMATAVGAPVRPAGSGRITLRKPELRIAEPARGA
jgi:hypothetical protein